MRKNKILFLLISVISCGFSDGADVDAGDDYEALSFVKEPKRLWENGEVYFSVDPKFSVEQKQQIRESMDYIVSKLEPGCIQFIRTNVDTPYFVDIKKDELACSSSIGRKVKDDRKTSMKLMNECFVNPGTVLHEIVHTLGAAHEHIRPDRNLFVDVDCELIKNGTGGLVYEQFTRKLAYAKTSLTPYDLRSIMHYRKFEIESASANPSNPVMKVRSAFQHIQDLNQEAKLELSPSDLVEISRNYNCSLKPGVEKQYVSYVAEITTALVDHMKRCLDGKEDAAISCLSGVKVANEYLLEWESWEDKSSAFLNVRKKLKGIEEDHDNTILGADADQIIDLFTEEKNVRGSRCP